MKIRLSSVPHRSFHSDEIPSPSGTLPAARAGPTIDQHSGFGLRAESFARPYSSGPDSANTQQ